MRKRISEHFRLLRSGNHINKKLQHAFNKYGEDNFRWDVEVVCEDPSDLDLLEESFITGSASFVEGIFYNVSDFAKAPMRGKFHSDEAREKIKKGRQATTFDYTSDDYRKTLSKAQQRRLFSDEKFVAKVKYIVENDGMTYAARGRAIGLDTSSVRKLYLKYKHMKGAL